METFEVTDDHIHIIHADDPDNKVIESIPLMALAVRMEMLDTDDPGVALELIRAEFDAPEDPYGHMMGVLAEAKEQSNTEPVLNPARMMALSILPVEVKAPTQADSAVKDHLRVELIDTINELREEARKELFHTNEEVNDE